MKKYNIKLLAIICLFILFCTVCFYNAQKESGSIENTEMSKVDYPLIDISFDEKSEWLVIVRTDLFTQHEKYNVSQNNENLNMNKEGLKILTFPVGRGTTPVGVVYVYQNGKLVKEVPFTEIFFESKILKDTFKNMSKEYIDKLIDGTLPPPI